MLLSFPTTDRELRLLKFISRHSPSRGGHTEDLSVRAKPSTRLLSISHFPPPPPLNFIFSALPPTSRIISRASMCFRHCSNLGVVTSLVCITVSIQSLLLCKARTHNSARVHFPAFNGHVRLYAALFPRRGAEISCTIDAVNLSSAVIVFFFYLFICFS